MGKVGKVKRKKVLGIKGEQKIKMRSLIEVDGEKRETLKNVMVSSLER